MSISLNGKVILNTRAIHQADPLNELLRGAGAIPVNYPCIEISPPNDTARLDQALHDLLSGQFEWLVLTSANTVLALAERLTQMGRTLADAPFRIAVIGTATAQATYIHLQRVADVCAPEQVAESLAQVVPIERGMRVLLPESALARPTLADQLLAKGAHVHVVTSYRTLCTQGESLPAIPLDAITFTSSSTVTCFMERIQAQDGQVPNVFGIIVASIGQKTTITARECGFKYILTAQESSLLGLIEALNCHFSRPAIDLTE